MLGVRTSFTIETTSLNFILRSLINKVRFPIRTEIKILYRGFETFRLHRIIVVNRNYTTK